MKKPHRKGRGVKAPSPQRAVTEKLSPGRLDSGDTAAREHGAGKAPDRPSPGGRVHDRGAGARQSSDRFSEKRFSDPRSNRRATDRRETHTEDQRRVRFSRELSILYEDEAVVVIDKPSGLLAVPIPGSDTPSAWSLLAERLERKKQKALIVHRIDRFSSGALLFAKTAADRRDLVQQFLAHTPVRRYLTVVRGRLAEKSGTLVHYFERAGMYQQLRSAKDPAASRAELRYSVERLFTNASLVRVDLVTGLQNQIRAQFSALGHPVVGDRKFHKAEAAEPLIARVALHAAHLEFVHPRTRKRIVVDCKLPPDFQHLIRELSRPVPAASKSETKAAAPGLISRARRAPHNPKARRHRG